MTKWIETYFPVCARDLAVVIFCSLLISAEAQAHGGRTNSEGCHNNRKTGEYHCHGGREKKYIPAVQPNYLVPDKAVADCPIRVRCYELTTCAQAKYYFEHCKMYGLDGDSDGVPCERLCR